MRPAPFPVDTRPPDANADRALPEQQGEPRYLTFKNRLRREILAGEWPAGKQIPPELDLCREYGLSRNTVQRALRDLVAEKLLRRERGRGTFVDYARPERTATVIGYLGPLHLPPGSPHAEMARGVERAARRRGVRLLRHDTRGRVEAMREGALRMNWEKAAGTIVVPLSGYGDRGRAANDDVLKALTSAGQAVTLLDSSAGEAWSGLPCVTSQNFEAARAMTLRLFRHGRRRLAFLRGPRLPSADERYAGYRAALEETGLAERPEYALFVGADDPSEQGWREADIFRSMREPPDGVLCMHDGIAAHFVKRSRALGVRVPGDWAVCGFDDSPEALACDPPLTTCRQHGLRMGERAAERLLDALAGRPDDGPTIERFPCELVVRASCGIPPDA